MKKILSFLGVLFLGSAAMGQTAKPDSVKKTDTRKVLKDDLKNTPPAEQKSAAVDMFLKIDGIKGASKVEPKHGPVFKEQATNVTIKGENTKDGKTAAKDSAVTKQTPRKG